eukprot:m.212051 g.212051  ORF g.212051 m.212051 type:complete len:221 (+) comp19031_c0_seq1:437-1099(+)
MEHMKWLMGYVSETANRLAYDADHGEVADEEPVDVAALFAEETSNDEIRNNWCILVEDNKSIQTIDINDVHTQRVRNRPKLANWETTEDLLIENPLELLGDNTPKSHAPWSRKAPSTYAEAARPSYAQILARQEHGIVIYDDRALCSRYTQGSSVPGDEHSAEDSDFSEAHTPVWTQVTGMVSNHATHRVARIAQYCSSLDVDWTDHCTSARWRRRNLLN